MKRFITLILFLVVPVASIWAQEKIITGKVISGEEDASPLPGVNVLVKGTSVGTITNIDGEYTIKVPSGQNTLVFSYIGFLIQEVKLESQTNVDVVLKPDATTLTEVIITGVAGNTETRKVSFAVGQVDEEMIQQAPGANPANALRSKVSGVTVVQGSGLPGAASSIRIRGASSLTGSQSPLIIVDGVILEGTLADINSEDIKSMEVLKGSAASSLYGSRAANGVIQIFTKRGSAKQGFSVKFRGEYGVSYVPEKRLPSIAQHHAYQLDANGEFALDDGGGYILDADGIANNPFPVYYNSIDEFYKPNTFHSEYFAVTNTSDRSNTLLSFQNLDQDGILSIDAFGYNRKNLRFNHDLQLNDRFRISTSNLFSNSTGVEPDIGSGSPFYTLLFTPPHVDLNEPNDDGTPYKWNAQIASGWPTTETNPLYTLNNQKFQRDRFRILTNLKAEYDITDFLTFETYYSIDYENQEFSLFVDKSWLDTENSTYLNGFISRSYYRSRGDNFSTTLKFDKTFNELNIKGKLNYFFENRTYLSTSASGSEIGISGFNDLNNVATDLESIGSNEGEIVANSYSMIVAFDYKDRYLADFLIRNDDVSLFGPNVRNQNFYRVSAAYRISEDLIIPGVQEWKLRASHGTAGLRPPYVAQYESFNVTQGVATKATLGNEDLGPFTSEELEVGTNISFLDMFDFEFNYAIKETKGQVIPVDLPTALGGWPSQWRNAGSLKSTSYEASLGANLLNKNNVSWNFNVLFTKNLQDISSLDRPSYQTGPNNAFLIEAGQPFGIFFGEKVITSFDELPEGADPNAFSINDDGYVVDADGIPQFLIDEETGGKAQVQIGDINHKFNMSFNSTFSFKGLSIYALVDWKQGGDVYNQTRQWTYRELLHPDIDQSSIAEGSQKPTDYYTALYNINATTSHFVEDGSYVKLRELSLNYTLPKKLFNNSNVLKGVKVGLVGRNLLTFSDYTGVDPEVTVLGSGDQTNFMFDGFGYPNFTTFTGSLQLTF